MIKLRVYTVSGAAEYFCVTSVTTTIIYLKLAKSNLQLAFWPQLAQFLTSKISIYKARQVATVGVSVCVCVCASNVQDKTLRTLSVYMKVWILVKCTDQCIAPLCPPPPIRLSVTGSTKR